MTNIEIAKNTGVKKAFVGHLINGIRKTTNIPLAIAVSKITGIAPEEYLSEKIRAYAIKINPKLKRKPKKLAS